MESFLEAWGLICDYCKKHITEVAYNSWISRIKPVSLDFSKGVATLEVPNEFHRQTLNRCYYDLLTEAFGQVFGSGIQIDLRTPDELNEGKETAAPEGKSDDYEFTFDTFIVGPSNKFAHAASLAVATKPAALYNPLFIYGNSGLGKTHLLYAICNEISRTYPDMNIIYIKGDDFTNEIIEAIRKGTTPEFRQKYRQADALLVDDIQFIAGKESTQEEFFHTFNALHGAGKQIIISSDKPPKEIARLEERLRSRFEWGLIADIQKPDIETRVAILRKKADSERIAVDDEVLELIAARIESNIRELEGALTRVVAFASLTGRSVDAQLAEEALRDILSVRDPKRITCELIQQAVAEYYGVSVADIVGQKRKREIALPRQVAIYLTREMTEMSLPRIGDAFKRDHSTIMHSCDKIAEMAKTSAEMAATVDDLKKRIQEK